MFHKKISKNQMMKMLLPYDNWFGEKLSVRDNDAQKALLQFLEAYKMGKLDKEYAVSKQGHISYLFKLIPIREALKEKHYQRTCNELITLIHDEPIFQKRIHYNLIGLLEENLNV